MVAGCVLMFATVPPLGIGVGIGLMETKGSPQHQLTGSTLQGMATRTFIHITVIEVLSHSAVNRIRRVAPMLVGFAVVTADHKLEQIHK